MNPDFRKEEFRRRLDEFRPDSYVRERLLAFYSVTVAAGDDDLMALAIDRGREQGVAREEMYEVILQSYLFLGFPRMLGAAMNLEQTWSGNGSPSIFDAPHDRELGSWRARGTDLCRKIYAGAYEPLKARVEPAAPEIFDWMITEGYGKVLSRPGLPIIIRELSIVAFLMAENRPQQLHSHMRGMLNVGGNCELLRTVVEDLGPEVGGGYDTALDILPKLGDSLCAE